ncbi:hypothetical protein D3C84_821830 [compost metagenome]
MSITIDKINVVVTMPSNPSKDIDIGEGIACVHEYHPFAFALTNGFIHGIVDTRILLGRPITEPRRILLY